MASVPPPVRSERPRPGIRRRSTRRPAIASSAGSRVIEARTTTSTARLAEIATPYRNETPMKDSPSSEIITVPPAMITLRPAVVTASTSALRSFAPASIAERNRVRISSE